MIEPSELPVVDARARKSVSRGARLAELARWAVRLSAVGYLVALLVVVAALRLVGERWWVTTGALYLPPIGWALPLPVLVLALLVGRCYRLLLTQVAAGIVLLFPLMGLHLSGPRAATPGATRFRIFTANIGLGISGIEPVLDRIRGTDPDVIVLEEVAPDNVATLKAGLSGYAFRALGQFVVASRFPIEGEYLPPPFSVDGAADSRHYTRWRLVTPGGPIQLYAFHPVSPHDAFEKLRGEGLIDEIRSGRILGPAGKLKMIKNINRRLAELRAVAEDAAGSPDPVVIAGDTNLPNLSWAFARWLGDYQDGFSETGQGFGYTYPAHKRVWMRIDRVLAGPRFRFLDAAAVPSRVSQHLAVTADLELLPATAPR
jgi:endonuclease/exonuclease/phosphatase (EEP) superfamily protein YafD